MKINTLKICDPFYCLGLPCQEEYYLNCFLDNDINGFFSNHPMI